MGSSTRSVRRRHHVQLRRWPGAGGPAGDRCGPTQHLLGSIQIEIDGDTAVSRSYVQARHQGLGDKSQAIFDTNGEYTDRWERRAEGWRIVRRDARWDLFSGDSAVLFG
jgi:hypothetical protein